MALSASGASAQLHALPDLNISSTAIGPIAIDANPDGTAHAVWVADNSTTPPRFVKVDTATSNILFPVQPTQYFSGGALNQITGMAVDPITRYVYIADGARQRVLRFDIGAAIDNHATKQTPAPLVAGCTDPCPPPPPLPSPSSSDGGFNAPAGLSATGSKVVAADSGNARIQTFDSDLSFVGKFTSGTWGSAKPVDTAVDPKTGHVFVALDSADRVDEFDAAGSFVKTIGSGAGAAAVAVEVDAASQLVFVAKSNSVDIYSEVSGKLVNTLAIPTGAKGLAVNTVSRLLYLSIAGTTNTVKAYSYDPPPTCTDAGAATLKNEAVSFALACGDLTGSPGLTYDIVAGPSNGTVVLDPATGAVTYTPAHNYLGEDEFTFRATTANGVSAIATAKLNVIANTPIVHQTANLGNSYGEIMIKLPGSDEFIPLVEDQLVPLGTIIDASDGHCIATFANADKTLYSATFWGGVFEMGQGVGDSPPAVMKLRDDEVDDAAAAATASASIFHGGLQIAKKKKKKNKVWGDGKGNFTTTGSGGSASVRGTRWLTQNEEDGTFFKVTRGKVLVRDYAKHKTVTLGIGDSYFAQKKTKKKKKK